MAKNKIALSQKSDRESAAIQEAAQRSAQAKESEINQRIHEFAKLTVYEGTLPENFSQLVRDGLRHYSEAQFRMPYNTYKGIAEVTNNRYTYQQMDVVMQVVTVVTADQLGMEMDEYLKWKDAVYMIGGAFQNSLSENKARIRSEYEMENVTPVAEA